MKDLGHMAFLGHVDCLKNTKRARAVAQQAKTLAAQPDDLSSVPGLRW